MYLKIVRAVARSLPARKPGPALARVFLQCVKGFGPAVEPFFRQVAEIALLLREWVRFSALHDLTPNGPFLF